jgi:hypothetical protein
MVPMSMLLVQLFVRAVYQLVLQSPRVLDLHAYVLPALLTIDNSPP